MWHSRYRGLEICGPSAGGCTTVSGDLPCVYRKFDVDSFIITITVLKKKEVRDCLENHLAWF